MSKVPTKSDLMESCKRSCPACEKIVSIQDLRLHILNNHFNFAPFICQVCWSDFNSEHQLELHCQLKHDNVKKVLAVCDESTWTLVNTTVDKCVDSMLSNHKCNENEFQSSIQLLNRLPFGLNALFGLPENLIMPSSMDYQSSTSPDIDFLQDCSLEDIQVVNTFPQASSKRGPGRPRVWKKNWETRSRINKLFESVTLRKLKVGARWYVRCSLCDQPVADDKWNLKTHVLYHLRSKNAIDGLFTCLVCDRRGFLQKRECFKHLLTNHGVNTPIESVHFNDKTTENQRFIHSEMHLCFPDASNVR